MTEKSSSFKPVVDRSLLQSAIHKETTIKGFWDDKTILGVAVKIALVMTEAAECLEAHRQDNIHGKNGVIEELADVVIRCFDLAEFYNVDLMEIVVEKHLYNITRNHKHGKLY